MIFLWLLVYIIEGCPDILNGNGNDTAWLITGVICLAVTLAGRD